MLKSAQASLAQAQANYDHQQADTSRIVALAKHGIMSAQAKDDAATSLQASKAAVDAARDNVSAAEASSPPSPRSRTAHHRCRTHRGRTREAR